MYRITLALQAHESSASVQQALELRGYLVSHHPSSAALLPYPDLLICPYAAFVEWHYLRSTYRHSEPLVVVIAPTLEDAIGALEAGADDAVRNPDSLQELLSRVGARLRRRQLPCHLLRVGSLLMDTLRYTVRLQDQPLCLSPLEMRLLQTFLEAQGQPLSKEFLYQKVWQTPYTEGDRAIDPTIRRLRAKLGEMADALETIRNYGYCLHRSLPAYGSQHFSHIDAHEVAAGIPLPSLSF